MEVVVDGREDRVRAGGGRGPVEGSARGEAGVERREPREEEDRIAGVCEARLDLEGAEEPPRRRRDERAVALDRRVPVRPEDEALHGDARAHGSGSRVAPRDGGVALAPLARRRYQR